MNAIQLDEDCDAKHLVRACLLEGKVSAIRFPARMKSWKDPEVLNALLPQSNPILTLDVGFAEENSQFVPDYHPGIVIVNYDDDILRTMTTKGAQGMLADLKQALPDWNTLDISQSIVLVRNSTIEVSHCKSHNIVRDAVIDRTAIGWQDELRQRLAVNAALSS